MSDQKFEKVNWLRPVTFSNGVTASVSQKSGIVKLDIPEAGRRSPLLYADEIVALFGMAIEIARYLETNHDICPSKEAARESSKATRVKMQQEARAVQTLQQLDPATLEKALNHLLAQKKQA